MSTHRTRIAAGAARWRAGAQVKNVVHESRATYHVSQTMRRLEKMRRFNLRLPVYIPEIIYWLSVRPVLIYRRIRYGYSFRRIPLTQGNFAIVDEEDFDHLIQYKWQIAKRKSLLYAERHVRINGISTPVSMHRFIMNCPKDKCVDHINHNGLDNRRLNLRIVSWQQNSWNKRKQRGKYSSQYKGVSYDNRLGKWTAKIWFKEKSIYINFFDDEQSAAKAYDEKAKELFGEFACLNFPKQNPEVRK